MGVKYRVKSDNFWAAAAVGGVTQWVHVDVGATGRTTITAVPGKPLVLCNIVINTSGASGVTTVTDSGRGVIAQLKASVAEKDYHYQIPLVGNLVIDNNSASDMTVAFVRD